MMRNSRSHRAVCIRIEVSRGFDSLTRIFHAFAYNANVGVPVHCTTNTFWIHLCSFPENERMKPRRAAPQHWKVKTEVPNAKCRRAEQSQLIRKWDRSNIFITFSSRHRWRRALEHKPALAPALVREWVRFYPLFYLFSQWHRERATFHK